MYEDIFVSTVFNASAVISGSTSLRFPSIETNSSPCISCKAVFMLLNNSSLFNSYPICPSVTLTESQLTLILAFIGSILTCSAIVSINSEPHYKLLHNHNFYFLAPLLSQVFL